MTTFEMSIISDSSPHACVLKKQKTSCCCRHQKYIFHCLPIVICVHWYCAKYLILIFFYFCFMYNSSEAPCFKINGTVVSERGRRWNTQFYETEVDFSSHREVCYFYNRLPWLWRREIAQSLESLSTKRAIRVCARLDPLVIERWNSITVLLTCSHQCRWLVQKWQSMCYYVCVIMHVKDP